MNQSPSALPEEVAASLRVSSHAVDRFRERVGRAEEKYSNIVHRLKELSKNCPSVVSTGDYYYVRVTGQESAPFWIVIRGSIIRTVLTHSQYIANVDQGYL